MNIARLLPVVLLAISACADGGGTDDATAAGTGELNEAKIAVVESAALPIAEVSGLGQGRIGGKPRVLAIGDASTTLVSFSVGANGKATGIESHDLSRLFASSESQWEAVAGDGDGRIFVLAESSDTIFVVAPDLRSLVHRIKLVIPREHPLAKKWAEDENSRGEGMVLLSNGHIIVAKEKNPPALVEFAPRGEAAKGFQPGLALGDRKFALPSGAASEYVATKHWELKRASEDLVPDISDLAVDDQKRLVLLSDQGRAIARIERNLDVTEDKIDVKATFRLPGAVDKPEGLTFAGASTFVATDGKHPKDDALFRVTPLP